MEIEDITTIEQLVELVPFEEEIRRKGRDGTSIEDMFALLQSQFDNPMFKLVIVRDSSRIVGYYFGMICPIPGMQGLYVYRGYSERPKVFNLLEQITHHWAKSYGVTKEVVVTHNSPKYFIRKHGFRQVSVNLEREF